VRPDHDDEPPRSVRWPWTRVGLSGIVAALLPAAWVTQVDGCTQQEEGLRTGVQLVSAIRWDQLGAVAILSLVLLGTWLAPSVARAAKERIGLRLLAHAVGLGATVLYALTIVFVLDPIFARTYLEPAGRAVLTTAILSVFDAAGRGLLGLAELVRERRARGQSSVRRSSDGKV
jgi:hypothetical protein